MSTFRTQLCDAIACRGDISLLHARQSFLSYPAPWVLADLLLRDALLGISRGLPGFHPASTLPERISLHFTSEGAPDTPNDLADDPEAWRVLCRTWAASDAPAIQELDEDEVLVGLNRVVFLGDLPTDLALDLARMFHLSSSSLAQAGVSGFRAQGQRVSSVSVARWDALAGPCGADGVEAFGISGCPIRLRVEAGVPAISLVLGFPWGRVPLGMAGGRGVLLEDVRGLQGLRSFLERNVIAEAVSMILQRLDAGAEDKGEAEVGFKARVSALWDENPLGPAELLDAVTEVLPNLAIHYADAVAQEDEVTAMVLEQAIVELVTRQKERPVLLRGLVEMALQRGLAPHVDLPSGDVYWLPVGEFPEAMPPGAHDACVLPALLRS